MQTTDSITEKQWLAVYAIAEMLANEGADVNELKKAIAYLRAYRDRDRAGSIFFNYLQTLVKNGRMVGHSGKTAEYYDSIEKACKQHLQPFQDDVSAMLQILGWAARIIHYYKSGGSTDFVTQTAVPTRQADIAQVLESQDLKIDDVLEAAIANIKGVEVTYELLGSIRLTQKEHKKASSLSVGQVVKVKIVELKNGKPKKLQLME